ncbi:MAG TPA: helix-turn-helix transcriptional regulator [Paraburkholderia sp.]|uniref:helix-turn-helix domain-containing protein n=1 Tax=Paraburkholderia sp. TaxID=1926495 RepID=UPI002B4A8489|nr:helix-turn-helix transcriptional regulator [Paraburkholderia sp.]HKR46745.1 helix-turn-helix transcriptional regulator [Paraburkholderia sp.]
MENTKPTNSPEALGQCFSDNLTAMLAVGGKQRASGLPGPLSSASVQRRTGIARSTLRALKKARTADAHVNPDLGTISRIADALGVPPAFLLMRPQDWAEIALAIGDSTDYLIAATRLQQEDQFWAKNPIEKVLRACKVHPDARPIGVGASPEVDRVNARDEWRRRSSHKFDALMLRHAPAGPIRALLTAIASAMVSRTTPHNPDNHD